MNRTKIEEIDQLLINAFKMGASTGIKGSYVVEVENWLPNFKDANKALLAPLLAEDGGEVGEANDEEILSDMTYRSGARRVEQIRWYRKGFLDHKKLLSNSAPSNEASQHTKGERV